MYLLKKVLQHLQISIKNGTECFERRKVGKNGGNLRYKFLLNGQSI